MNKYEGPNSAYAKNEGVWVPGKGVNLTTGASIAALIIRDYLRGYTYDGKGRRIPMDKWLFKRRLFYLIPLCIKHTHRSPECDKLREIVEYAYENLRLPKNVVVVLAGPNARKVADELIRNGIVSVVRVLGEPMPTRPTRIPQLVKKLAVIPRRLRRKRRYGLF